MLILKYDGGMLIV